MLYQPKHYKAYQIVDAATYSKFGEQSLQFFRNEALEMLDQFHELFNAPILVNNWKQDGQFQWRGLRTVDFPGGAKWSAHRVGAAFDFNVTGLTPSQVAATILQNQAKIPHCRRMEDPTKTKGWTHCDVIETGIGSILIIQP